MTFQKGHKISNTGRTRFKSGINHLLYGKFRSEETKLKISKTLKKLHEEGRIIPPMSGKHLSDETKRKLSEAMKGKLIGGLNPAKRLEVRIKISESKRGEKNPFYGKHHSEEHKRRISLNSSGNKSCHWLDGKSFEPYTTDFNLIFKELIRQRDGLSCIKCNLFQEDHLKLYNKKLIIHHIDYNKKTNLPQNCCALCSRCNSEVNFNRKHWTKFFQSLLNERYGYRYSENGEIILNLLGEIEK